MTLHIPSRVLEADSPKATPDARPHNLLEVKTRLNDVAMPAARRSDLISALNAVARPEQLPDEKGLEQALARISVDARTLTARLDRRVGARLGYTRESWSNVGWRVRKALKLTSAWELFHSRDISLSPTWQQVVGRGTPALSRIRLLARWATLEGITPERLGEEHLPRFLNWLESWKPRNYALRCYFGALDDWNAAARARPGWPGRPVNVVRRLRAHYSAAIEDWSSELLRDIDRIIATLRQPDLDEVEPYEPISERTAKSYRVRLLRTLSAYVAARKIEPSSVQSLAELLAPAAAKAALDFMLQWIRRRKPEVIRTSEIHSSAKLLCTISERCYGELPADTILTLQKMARNRAPVRRGMSEKNRALLKLFDDEQFLARFLALPFDVFARVLKRPVLRRIDAVKLMLAFAVAQSTEAPLRPENQAGLIVGQHVSKRKDVGKEVLAIRVPANEVKNTQDLDFELSRDIVELYDAYMRVARPLIGSNDNPYLYPGPGFGPKCPGSLSLQVGRFMEDELGVHLTGQQFRHAIGYLYLKSNPGDYEVVRQLLGHKDINTTMLFYAALDMRTASRKVSTFVAQRREALAPLLRKRRRRLKK